MAKRNLLLTLGIPLLTLLLGIQLGAGVEQRLSVNGANPPATGSGIVADPQRQADISLLWQVWKLLNSHYIDPQKLQQAPLVYGAVEGMVRAVGDPYTVFMDPQESNDFHQELAGSLQGIGAELTIGPDGLITVASPLKGSPAEKAGLLPKDVIIKVDGKSVESLSLTQVVDRIRGKKGTTVTLTVLREKATQPVTLSIVRDTITIPSVESRVIQGKTGPIGYVALHEFGDRSEGELVSALDGFQKQNLKGIILDLRDNGGGYLDGAVDIVSLFLPKGNVVEVQSREAPLEVHAVSGHPMYPDIPLAVLQNEGSASASEITAGALQDNHRAEIIGAKSFGKGTVQEVLDLPGGGSLRVTIARWLTPNGKNIGSQGIQPDVAVPLIPDDRAAKKDPQLDAAVRWVESGKPVGKQP